MYLHACVYHCHTYRHTLPYTNTWSCYTVHFILHKVTLRWKVRVCEPFSKHGLYCLSQIAFLFDFRKVSVHISFANSFWLASSAPAMTVVSLQKTWQVAICIVRNRHFKITIFIVYERICISVIVHNLPKVWCVWCPLFN